MEQPKVHDVSGLDVGDSDSEDEWNYVKGEEANKGGKPNLKVNLEQPENPVAETTEEDDDTMSQLNPNAAEFVPVSPTRSIPSPVCRNLINDEIISQSPSRPNHKDMDVKIPTGNDFANEIKSRPSDFDNGYKNGHDSGDNATELIENILNGRDIDDIPEFLPGSTPTKQDEFHFGPNATPFTPAKPMDQSEAAASTRALFGDDTLATLDDSTTLDNSTVNFLSSKESDPMSMSFYDGKEGENPFDLNKVQLLPDLDDGVDKLPQDAIINNDDGIETTDLDKLEKEDVPVVDKNHYEEKELASPVSQDDLSDICQLPKTPEPAPNQAQNNDLPEPAQEEIQTLETPEVCDRPESKSPLVDMTDYMATMSLELNKSPMCDISESKSPISEQDIPMSPEPALQTLASEPQPTIPGLDISNPILSPEPFKAPSPVPPQEEEISRVTPEPQQFEPTPEPQQLEPTPEPQQLEPTPEPQQFETTPEPEQPEEPKLLSPEPIEQQQEPEEVKPLTPEPEVLSPEPQALSPEPQPLSPEVQVLSTEPQDSDLSSPIEEEKHDVCKLDKPIESPHEDITSSVKDDVSSPTSPEPQPIVEQIPIEPQEPIAQEVPEPEAAPEVCSLADKLVALDLEPANSEPFVVQTENIAPEFAESAIVLTPSESSEAAPVPVAAPVVEPVVVAPVVVEEPKVEAKPAEKKTATSATKAKPAVGAVKKSPAPKSSPAGATKTATSRLTSKPATTPPAKTMSPKTSVTKSASSTTAAAKPAAPKTSSSTLAARKPLSKPAADKKPLTNGDVKAPAKPPSTLVRKTLDGPKPASARPAPATRASPTKPPVASARPATAPRTTTSAPRTASSTLSKTSSNSLSKPGASATSVKSTTATTKSALNKPAPATAPKTTTAPKPRVPLSSSLTKPRVPLTKSATKAAPDAEKQNKESANKLTASRVTTTTRTTGAAAASTTTRRIELTKNIGSRTTVTKTTTTTTATTKSSSPKKPAEIIRKATKTTAIKQPNGLHTPPVAATTTVEEQITIVNNIINDSDGIVKPTSPIDNKLIVEAPLIEANCVD